MECSAAWKSGGKKKTKRRTLKNRNVIRMTSCLCARTVRKGYKKGSCSEKSRIRNTNVKTIEEKLPDYRRLTAK